MNNIDLVIISGRSGSGKSIALRALEDLGFYCIDNLPVYFLPKLINESHGKYSKIAISIDIRNIPSNMQSLDSMYQEVKALSFVKSTIIYIDSSDDILLKRYLETRRIHPLSFSNKNLSLHDAIELEKKLLLDVASHADLRIDTSNLSIHQLASQITTLILGSPKKQLVIIFESFGFKYGIAKDADFVFDSRFLPNPYWVEKLRNQTGLDAEVIEFFEQQGAVKTYIEQINSFLEYWLGQIEQSNRSYLTVAIGCTGGRHRSVYIAQYLGDLFAKKGQNVKIRHKELQDLDEQEKK